MGILSAFEGQAFYLIDCRYILWTHLFKLDFKREWHGGFNQRRGNEDISLI